LDQEVRRGRKPSVSDLPGGGQLTDKDFENSHVHACSFPFAGRFRGAGWNTQSLFAYGQEDTQRYTLDLATKHDFIALSETRGTVERSASLEWEQHAEYDYFFSDLDQYKGGIGLLLKRSFLRRFRPIERQRD
jgi:hypothetical protein